MCGCANSYGSVEMPHNASRTMRNFVMVFNRFYHMTSPLGVI